MGSGWIIGQVWGGGRVLLIPTESSRMRGQELHILFLCLDLVEKEGENE